MGVGGTGVAAGTEQQTLGEPLGLGEQVKGSRAVPAGHVDRQAKAMPPTMPFGQGIPVGRGVGVGVRVGVGVGVLVGVGPEVGVGGGGVGVGTHRF